MPLRTRDLFSRPTQFFTCTVCINTCLIQCSKTSRCFSKDWDVTEYGVCELADIISEIPDTTICLSQQDNEMVICIPKRGMSMYSFTIGKEIVPKVYWSGLDFLII